MRIPLKKKSIITLFLILSIGLTVSYELIKKDRAEVDYIYLDGQTQGTYYSIIYLHPEGCNLQNKVDHILEKVDLSLSIYNPNSIISQINRNIDTVLVDDYFKQVFVVANKVAKATNGAFDITVGPLVNAWGFGKSERDTTKVIHVNQFMPLIGYKKISITNNQLRKENNNILLDVNAIAQGYTADLIADLLKKEGCDNYLVDVGGEIVCKGRNPKGNNWQVGIDKPIDDVSAENRELQTIIQISNMAVTTSGNYRKFYYFQNKKYSHTIDPRSGYPVTHNLLSATVIYPSCTVADAYATAFMVLGVDSAMLICKQVPNMECFLIYSDHNGNLCTTHTPGFKRYLTQ